MILLLSIPVWLYRNRIKLHLHSEHLYRCHQHAYSHKSGRYHVKRPWHRDRPLIHKFIIVRLDQRGLSSDDLREAVSFSSVKALTTNFLYYVYTNRAPWWGSIALLCVYPCNIKSYEFHKKKNLTQIILWWKYHFDFLSSRISFVDVNLNSDIWGGRK